MAQQNMAYWIAPWLLLALAACDTVSRAQFQIPDASGDSAQRERVIAVVQSAAVNAGMVDRTGISKAANTLVYFEEPVKSFATSLGARRVGDSFIIDLACFHPGGDTPPSYSVTRTSLEKALQHEFGQNWRRIND